eukprot:4114236-Heterocapsa_arctica.AAC.1
MSLRFGPAAFLRCFLAALLEASMTVLSLLTFTPLFSSASQPPIIDIRAQARWIGDFLPGGHEPVVLGMFRPYVVLREVFLLVLVHVKWPRRLVGVQWGFLLLPEILRAFL